MIRSISLAGVLILANAACAQTQFIRQDTIPAMIGNQPLPYAWAGGMNFVQFSDIDLDLDGINDLFVFDRSGNKITTFLNSGTPNTVDYKYAPQYIPHFPRMHDWVLLRDYNNDGRADIFTSNASQVQVYKNISTLASGLQFELVTDSIVEDRAPNSMHTISPLNVSWIDIPAIRDVDGDGDLDILNYGIGGTQMEYHKNLSMETYGVPDSLLFTLQSMCWGEFTESQYDATLTLNTPCAPPPVHAENSSPYRLHGGSCMECINTDGDNDQDLLIGDLSNTYINLLRNGGTATNAIGDTVDDHYPGYDTPAQVNLFGCGFHLDVDNDGKKDVLFSANNNAISENFHSAWYYHNTGANDSVVAHYVTDRFLVDGMIDVGEGAMPVFFDFDHDGDKDLFIGNRGYFDISGLPLCMIALYRNDGTAMAPSYVLQTTDFAGLNAQSISIRGPAPTFGDIDGDGDEDMLVGDQNGNIHFFRKNSGNDTNFVLAQANFLQPGGSFLVPQLVDVDRDGLLDLLVGKQNGAVAYYRNTGTASSPAFTLITGFFGGVFVTQTGFTTGYSAPFLYDVNGSYVLFVGSERGFLFRYDNIDGNLSGTFTLTDSLYVSSWEGGRITPAVTDLNSDGLFDVAIGNYAGGVTIFYGANGVGISEPLPLSNSFSVYPNPASSEISIETGAMPEAVEHFEIFSAAGQLVREEKISQQRTAINISDLAPGVYICRLTDSNGFCTTRKLIVQ